MKRILCLILVLLTLFLTGCGKDLLPSYCGNDAHLIDTEYFTLTLPPDLQGNCEYNIETFDDGTYELILYQEDQEIFNLRLFPMYQVADGYSLTHGILATPKGDYELFSRLPEGVEFSPENLDVYDAIVDEYARITDGLEPKKGCEHLVPQLEASA